MKDPGAAEQWIAGHQRSWESREAVQFAIVLRETESLIGAISLVGISAVHERAELGYWIGREYWNHGYCTEAARAVVSFGFDVLGLHRIHARFLKRNPASGRVMEKIGMRREGCLREHDKKWDRFEDLVLCGILRREHREHAPAE